MPNSLSMLVEVLPLTVFTGVMMSSALAQSPASRVEFTTKETASVTDERSGVTKSQSRTFARRKDGSVREEIAAYDRKPKPVFARSRTAIAGR